MKFGEVLSLNIKKAREVLEQPNDFFKKAKKEKLISESFTFFVLLSFLGAALGVFYTLLMYPVLSQVSPALFPAIEPLTFAEVLPFVITSYAFTVVLSFVWGAVLFVWLKIWKANGTYGDAYRLYVYSRTPSYLLGWVPFVSIAAWLYSLYLMILGTHVIYKMSLRRSAIIFITPLVLFFVLLFIAVSALGVTSNV